MKIKRRIAAMLSILTPALAPCSAASVAQLVDAIAPLPADHQRGWPALSGLPVIDNNTYVTAVESGTDKGWEQRVAHQWDYFAIPADNAKILVIDYAQKQGELAFRYLANDDTQNTLYEPWSSSKIMAFTAAISRQPESLIQPDTLVGTQTRLADLITSIHSYAPSGNADGNSNAIATYFANVAGRDYLTALFHDGWLHMENGDIRFRGTYGPLPFTPDIPAWRSKQGSIQQAITPFASADADPGYQTYRCDTCGLTGNKPMTTLAEAEFLKRIVTHDAQPTTRMPHLTNEGALLLLYGADGKGGMMQSVNTLLHHAIAQAIRPGDTRESGAILDEATGGKWRIFQKTGSGPSETRGQAEMVILAHVYLPFEHHTRAFTLAVQTQVAGETEDDVLRAAAKLDPVLDTLALSLLSTESHGGSQ